MNRHLIAQLHAGNEPLRVPLGGAVEWDDESAHAAAFAADPERYALFALIPGVSRAQRARAGLSQARAGPAASGRSAASSQRPRAALQRAWPVIAEVAQRPIRWCGGLGGLPRWHATA